MLFHKDYWTTASILILGSISLLCFAWPAVSQDIAPTTLHVQSNLVQLDVSVTDKTGALVTDLTKDDFTVYENGKRQTIRNFDAFNAHYLTPQVISQGVNSTADLQRLAPAAPVIVLVLDELNTDFGDNAFARTQIRKYLQGQSEVLAQPTSLLVATDDGFEQVADYTLDRSKLLHALERLKPMLPGELMRTGGSPEGVAMRFAQTLASLQQIAEAGAGHHGRKNVIWVGRGFDSIDLRDAASHQVELVKGAAERALNLMKDSNVVLFTIDPTLSTKMAAEPNSDQLSSSLAPFTAELHNTKDPFDGTVSFNTFAPETGGKAFSMNNGLDQEINASVIAGTQFYTLSYVPGGDYSPNDPYRRIDVQVDRPGLAVSTRRGYFTQIIPPASQSQKQQLKAQGFDIGTAVVSNMSFTGIGILAASSQSNPAEYIIRINTNDLQWESQSEGGPAAHLLLVAVGLDKKNKPVSKNAKEITARLDPGIPVTSIPFAVVKIDLPRAAGASKVRIIVRDSSTGKLGSADMQSPGGS